MMNGTKKENSDILALAKFSDRLLQAQHKDELFDLIIDQIMETINCTQASLMVFDLKCMEMQFMRVRGFRKPDYKTPIIGLSDDVAQCIFAGGEVLAPFQQDGLKFLIIFDEDERKYFDCELRIPFFILEHTLGVINLGKKATGTEYSSQEIKLLQIFINMSTLALEKQLFFRQQHRIPLSEKTANENLNIQIKHSRDFEEMIGSSPAMKKIKAIIKRVASKDVTVCITGESGTGKELVAKAIHCGSSRQERPLVTLNCAALPENLVESELFGHEKGAFTGAYKQKIGKFEYANGSTLFLDEIGDMSLSTQSKLLRVLQDKTVQRIGGHNCIEADVRIIVATHKDLNELIKTGCFREDLFYRINVVQIHVPPLRERKEDIPPLADYFIKKFNTFYKTAISPLTEDELRKLMRYDFPGNVRELKNIIERAVILAHDGHLSLDFLPQLSNHTQPKLSHPSNITLENLEKDYIKTVLEQAQYNKTKAARILGIARKTLREKMAKYQIQIKSDD